MSLKTLLLSHGTESVIGMSAFLWSGVVSGNELVNDLGTGNITITGKDFAGSEIPYTSVAKFSMSPALSSHDTDGFWFNAGVPKVLSVQDLVECISQRTLVKQGNTDFKVTSIGMLKSSVALSPAKKTLLSSYFQLWCYHFGSLNLAGYFKYNRGLQDGNYGYEISRWTDANNVYGVQVPGSSVLEGWDQFIKQLKEAGLFTRMKLGYILNSGSLQANRLNIRDTALYRSTIYNAPVFTEGQGTKSDGSGYIDPGMAANAIDPQNFTVIQYVSESSTSSLSQDSFGARTNTDFTLLKFQPKTGANGGFSNGFASNGFANANHKGLYVMTYQINRPVMYKDGVKSLGAVETPSIPNLPSRMLILARNISTTATPNASGHYTRNIGANFFFDGFTDEDESTFRSIFEANKSAMGLP